MAPSRTMQSLLKFSERFGDMLSNVLLTILYYGVLGPFALVYQLVADPLHLRRRPRGNWTGWDESNDTLAAARRQD
jgi:hypothetical protein